MEWPEPCNFNDSSPYLATGVFDVSIVGIDMDGNIIPDTGDANHTIMFRMKLQIVMVLDPSKTTYMAIITDGDRWFHDVNERLTGANDRALHNDNSVALDKQAQETINQGIMHAALRYGYDVSL